MSVDTTMAVLYAQSGLSTNVANAAMVAPQASLAMTRILTAEAARQEQQQVEKSEKTKNPNITDREGRGGYFQSRFRARRKIKHEDKESGLTTTPFSGNLLNVKI